VQELLSSQLIASLPWHCLLEQLSFSVQELPSSQESALAW
jgi:hypothetical protein